MKETILLSVFIFTLANVWASGGERPSKDSNQKVTLLHVPEMDAFIQYDGGDTLYILVENTGAEDVKIKLLGGNITLFNDRLHRKPQLKRAYVISAFPQGDYRIRLKKGNYVVEKTFTKTTVATEVE